MHPQTPQAQNALLECSNSQSSSFYWQLGAEETEVNEEQKASRQADVFNITLGYGGAMHIVTGWRYQREAQQLQ